MRGRAFTLVELLVVIAILGILMALLMSGLGGVRQAGWMTQCQMHLKRIWDAQGVWRAERVSSHFAVGPDWPTRLLPYLEDQLEVLVCPARHVYGAAGPQEGGTVLTLRDIAFEIYSGSKYLYDIPLDSDFIVILPGRDKGAEWKEFQIEDQRTGGDYKSDHRDIVVEVLFVGGAPSKIYFSPHHSGHGYNFKFKIKDEIIYNDYDGKDKSMIGTVMDLGEYGVAASDYGMSLGCYEVAKQQSPTPIDSKLFFIVDYAKSIADYNEDGQDDQWRKFFITDAKGWTPPDGFEAASWQQVQSLRHFGQANMLFLDGHVEPLVPDPQTVPAVAGGKYLRPDSPLWRYRGL